MIDKTFWQGVWASVLYGLLGLAMGFAVSPFGLAASQFHVTSLALAVLMLILCLALVAGLCISVILLTTKEMSTIERLTRLGVFILLFVYWWKPVVF